MKSNKADDYFEVSNNDRARDNNQALVAAYIASPRCLRKATAAKHLAKLIFLFPDEKHTLNNQAMSRHLRNHGALKYRNTFTIKDKLPKNKALVEKRTLNKYKSAYQAATSPSPPITPSLACKMDTAPETAAVLAQIQSECPSVSRRRRPRGSWGALRRRARAGCP